MELYDNFKREISKLKKGKKNFVFILIGPQTSGKSTFIKECLADDITIYSKDDIVMELFPNDEYDYNKSYKDYIKYSYDNNNDIVNSIFAQRITTENHIRRDVVIDCMNLTELARGKIQYKSQLFIKVAIIFPFPSLEEFKKRNTLRLEETQKYISEKAYLESINGYVEVDKDKENIQHIIYL